MEQKPAPTEGYMLPSGLLNVQFGRQLVKSFLQPQVLLSSSGRTGTLCPLLQHQNTKMQLQCCLLVVCNIHRITANSKKKSQFSWKILSALLWILCQLFHAHQRQEDCFCWGWPSPGKQRYSKISQMKAGEQLAELRSYCQCKTWPVDGRFRFPRPPVYYSLHAYERWNNFVTEHTSLWQTGLTDFRQHIFLRKYHILADFLPTEHSITQNPQRLFLHYIISALKSQKQVKLFLLLSHLLCTQARSWGGQP